MITVGLHQYNTGKLSVFEQFRIAKRLVLFLPVFSSSSSLLDELKKIEPGADLSNTDKSESDAAKVLTLTAMSRLSDEDAIDVINTCLNAVTRKNDNGVFSKVRSGGHLMFEDISLDDMLTITYHMIRENLGSFFPASSLQPSPAPLDQSAS